MKQKISTKRGFTIIETLVAITILVAGITAPMTIAYRTAQTGAVAQDNIQAFYLAQEGIEFIRYVRDTNVLRDSDSAGLDDPLWLNKLTACTSAPGCYISDITERVLNSNPAQVVGNCGGAGCPFVTYDSTSGLYDDGPPTIDETQTKFTRTIFISQPTPNIEADVTVRVEWQTRAGNTKEVVVRERLFNWTGF